MDKQILTVQGTEVVCFHGGEDGFIRDMQLARMIGLAKPRNLRERIKAMLESGALKPEWVTIEADEDSGNPVYYLGRNAALKIITRSETPIADEIANQIIDVFISFHDGKLVEKTRDRDRFLEVLVREAGKGNPVAVETLISQYGYPASIRAEVAKAVEYRKEKRKPTPQTPEIVTWFMEDFLPRLAEEVRGEKGVLFYVMTHEPFKIVENQHSIFNIEAKTADLLAAVRPLAAKDGVDVRISAGQFGTWLAQFDGEIRELGWVRRLVRQVHGSRIYEMTLLA